jgi:hypothetical protein
VIGDLLYHGSSDKVETVDLARSAPNKDFGAGFYTTTELGQAEAFARLKARRKSAGAGWVSVFRLGETRGLRVRSFARSTAIRLLLSQRLHDQVFFGTPQAVAALEFVEVRHVRVD